MRIRFMALSLTAVAAVVTTSLPLATSAAPAAGDTSSLSFFTGTWSCKTTKSSDPKKIGQIEPNTVTMTKTWSKVQFPGGAVYVTRDVKLNKTVDVFVGDDGSYGIQRAPGWAGDKLVFADIVNSGGDPLGTETITKVNATTFTNNYTVKTPSGSRVFEQACTKKT